jgi:hypothetical protein
MCPDIVPMSLIRGSGWLGRALDLGAFQTTCCTIGNRVRFFRPGFALFLGAYWRLGSGSRALCERLVVISLDSSSGVHESPSGKSSLIPVHWLLSVGVPGEEGAGSYRCTPLTRIRGGGTFDVEYGLFAARLGEAVTDWEDGCHMLRRSATPMGRGC